MKKELKIEVENLHFNVKRNGDYLEISSKRSSIESTENYSLNLYVWKKKDLQALLSIKPKVATSGKNLWGKLKVLFEKIAGLIFE